ncbi:MAG: adenylate/guanylate cyclase domain-containing protein [Candidatus Rifleibacteriota bacterium]
MKITEKKEKKTGWAIFCLIWLFLIFFPTLAARHIFEQSLEMELWVQNSMLRQKLNLEMKKYETALKGLDSYVYSVLDKGTINQNIIDAYGSKSLNVLAGQSKLLEKLARIPNEPRQTDMIAEELEKQLQGKLEFIYVFSPERENCGWRFLSPLKALFDDDSMRKMLKAGHANLLERFRSEIRKDHLKVTKLVESEGLSENLGIFQALDNSLTIQIHRFSVKINQVLYIWSLPITGENGDLRFVICGISNRSIRPELVVRHFAQKFSSSQFQHKVVISNSEEKDWFVDDHENLSMISELPGSFLKIQTSHSIPAERDLKLVISCPSPVKYLNERRASIRFFLLLYATLLSILFVGGAMGKIRLGLSLRNTILSGFLAGVLLPVTGFIWLSFCYLGIFSHLQAESVLDHMEQRIFEKEKEIELQASRSIFFRNYFAQSLSRLEEEELKNINLRTGFILPGNKSSEENSRKRVRLGSRFFVYSFITPEIDNYVGVAGNGILEPEVFQTFFSGISREVLLKGGAFAHLDPDNLRARMQRSRLTMGLIDSSADYRVAARTFADEMSPVLNQVALGRSFITTSFWRRPNGKLKGLSFLQSDHGAWEYDIYKLLNSGKIKRKFEFEGFNISIHHYLTHSYSLRELSLIGEVPVDFTNQGRGEFFWEMARASFQHGNEMRINNLVSQSPHLLKTGTVADGHVFILAYATPSKQRGLAEIEAVFLMIILAAIIVCFVLARALSWALTRPLRPFVDCIKFLQNQDYEWKLDVRSGDEFDQLGEAFDHLSLKLLEKEKISRLVSRNVLDVVNQGDNKQLSSGGSRVKAAILFSDIRNFTGITESCKPEEVVEMLNDYLTIVNEIIERNGGLIDKLIGDAVQAVFYEHECANAATAAVNAAVEIRRSLPLFNLERRERGLFEIENGVGIATGMVVCGRIGSQSGKMDATLIGFLLNKSQQLESMSKHGRFSRIFVDEATRQEIAHELAVTVVKQQGSNSFEIKF